MGLFGTFVARKLGYMRSSLSNRDLNRLISDKISELDKDEQNAEDALKQKLYHTITHKFNLQLQTIETIDFYLKVKTVRIMEQNKHAMQEIKNEISHWESERKKWQHSQQHSKTADTNEIRQLKHILHTKELDNFNRKINELKQALNKCEEFEKSIKANSIKQIKDYNIIRSNA